MRTVSIYPTHASPRKRVALFVADLDGRGVQRVTLNLVLGFQRQGIDCDLVLTRAKGELLDDVPPEVRIIDLGASGAIKALPALMSYLRREKPWAMIVAEDNTNVVGLLARGLTGHPGRISVGTHVSPRLWAAGGNLLEKRFWLRQAVRLTYPLATARVAVSRGMADEMADIFRLPRNSISVIFNPVVTPELLKSRDASPPHPWLADGRPPVILGVGNLTPIKGFHVLVQAFAELRKHRETRLIILGRGQQAERLKQLSEELGVSQAVAFPGFVQNPYAYLVHAGLFVLSSTSEGLPTALIEAMACGCPVVSTDCPSGPAEILENGVHGPLVPPNDPWAMADAMRDRLSSPRNAEAMRTAAERFHVDRILTAYRDLLKF